MDCVGLFWMTLGVDPEGLGEIVLYSAKMCVLEGNIGRLFDFSDVFLENSGACTGLAFKKTLK